MDASLSWMQRACAQFERSAGMAVARATQSERQLVSALAAMAEREADREELAVERAPDEPAPVDESAAMDAQIMGALAQRFLSGEKKG